LEIVFVRSDLTFPVSNFLTYLKKRGNHDADTYACTPHTAPRERKFTMAAAVEEFRVEKE